VVLKLVQQAAATISHFRLRPICMLAGRMGIAGSYRKVMYMYCGGNLAAVQTSSRAEQLFPSGRSYARRD
jgi:hypothetical protein